MIRCSVCSDGLSIGVDQSRQREGAGPIGPWANPIEVAGDGDTLTYDENGNMQSAHNGDARVSRSYYPNGALRTDTLRVRTMTGADFSRHVYGIGYTYDLNGRRSKLAHPGTVARTRVDTTRYGYHAVTGDLELVTDPSNYQYRYSYDYSGRQVRLDSPGKAFETRAYDLDGNDTLRIEKSGSWETLLHEENLRYDAHGRMVSSTGLIGKALTNLVDPVWEGTEFTYSGLGALTGRRTESDLSADGGPTVQHEEYASDALGNRIWSRRYVADRLYGDSVSFQYDAANGRLRRSSTKTFDTGSSDSSGYDAAGNRTYLRRFERDTIHAFTQTSTSYYGADLRLRAVDKAVSFSQRIYCGHSTCPTWWPDHSMLGAFEEYRYDALGRRVLMRTRRDGLCPGVPLCQSTITRTVWDGDAVLYEMRYPGGNNVTGDSLEQETGFARTTWNGVPIVTTPTQKDSTGDTRWEDDLMGTTAWDDDRMGTTSWDDEGIGTTPWDDDRMGTTPSSPPRWSVEQDTVSGGGGGTSASVPLDTLHPYGRVQYTHGLALDRPLGILRFDHRSSGPGPVLIVPHRSSVGGYDVGTYYNGDVANGFCSGYGCPLIVDWPGRHATPWQQGQARKQPRSWIGSLVESSTDGSGMQYMRNRYYDPVHGRFTQEDPIGLAGGLNLYGYANGDPVNYSDPFGLSPVGLFAKTVKMMFKRISREQALKGTDDVFVVGRSTSGDAKKLAKENGPVSQRVMTLTVMDNFHTISIRTGEGGTSSISKSLEQ